jgi:hypothetical protein
MKINHLATLAAAAALAIWQISDQVGMTTEEF